MMAASRRSSILRGFFWFIVLALAVGGAYFVWQRETALRALAAGVIRQEVVERGTIIAAVSATGNLEPEQQVNLHFASAAPLPVTAVYVKVGQAVAAGQELARLDDRDLALAVREAELALATAELALAQLTAPPRAADVALAEANVAVARSQLYSASLARPPQEVEIARLNLLLAQNALNSTYAAMESLVEQDRWTEKNALQVQADRQVEEARAADLRYQAAQRTAPQGQAAAAQAGVEQAEANLARLLRGPSEEDVAIAELRVRQAEAALENAQFNLDAARLTAPFDGLVAAVNLRAGETAAAALPAVVLADVDHFFLDVSVDEVDVALVAPGQPVTVTLDALPDTPLTGSVVRISPSASAAAGVVSYPVRLILAGGAAQLRGGMTATAAIVVDEAPDALRVPNWAIRRDRETGETFVGVMRAGVIEDVPVTLGLRDEAYSQVLTGIEAGDVVAVDTAREVFSLFGSQ